MGTQDRYLYLHIPKTGGVSFRQVFENAFPVHEILHVTNAAEAFTGANESLFKYRFIHGHFRVSDIEHLSGFKKITSLRNPVNRCISTYNFWRSLKDSPKWSEKGRLHIRSAQQLSLEALIDHPELYIRRQFNNIQTRILCGIADNKVSMTSEHLDMALKQLESFDFIALNEQLEDSRRMLCLKFGFYFSSAPVRLNQSSVNTPVSAELIERLKASNELDIQLVETLQGRGLLAINCINLPF